MARTYDRSHGDFGGNGGLVSGGAPLLGVMVPEAAAISSPFFFARPTVARSSRPRRRCPPEMPFGGGTHLVLEYN
jgi:hypothetical protein